MVLLRNVASVVVLVFGIVGWERCAADDTTTATNTEVSIKKLVQRS